MRMGSMGGGRRFQAEGGVVAEDIVAKDIMAEGII
jgi:hypothetical protein